MPNPTHDHGPFETEHQALATSAVRAVYQAYDAGTTSLLDGAADLLLAACEQVGVTLGAYDRRILVWLAGFEPQAAAAVSGIVIRAAVRSPRDVAFDLGDDHAITYFCLAESLQAWGAPAAAGYRGGRQRAARSMERPGSRDACRRRGRIRRGSTMTNSMKAWGSRLTAGLALGVVASVTGVISYTHVYDLTVSLHQSMMVARLMPFGVDGLIVVGSVVLLQSAPGQAWLGWLGIVPVVAASLFANVESGLRWGPLAAGWAGVPAASFALATFLLERWLKAQAGHGGQGGTETPCAHYAGIGESRSASQCPHGVAATAEDAVVQAFLHARDCAESPLSQRHLAVAFGLSRPKVAELVSPLLAEATATP